MVEEIWVEERILVEAGLSWVQRTHSKHNNQGGRRFHQTLHQCLMQFVTALNVEEYGF